MKNYKTIFVAVLMIFICQSLNNPLYSQSDIESKLPKVLSSSNMGKEFYFSFIPAYETPGKTNVLKVLVSSRVETEVTLEIPGRNYSETKTTIANSVITFTLTPELGQPYARKVNIPPNKDSIYNGAGIHIKSNDPVICYGVSNLADKSEGFLILPINVLGRDYIISSFADNADNSIIFHTSYTTVTGVYDNTKVKFTMGGTSYSSTSNGQRPGETIEWTLNGGDVLLIASIGEYSDLSGSIISADKLVSVVCGNYCASVPNSGDCNILEEMQLPTDMWGKEYHVTKIIERSKNSNIKILAKEPKTKIFRDYEQIGYIRDAGGTEGRGFLYFRVDEGPARPIIISGDKPINVTQYNSSKSDDNVNSFPFQMTLMPVESYQNGIYFNTSYSQDKQDNYINIIYEATEYGTIPSDLSFGMGVAEQMSWQLLMELSPNPGSPFLRLPGGKYYYSKTLKLPRNGFYALSSSKPLTAYYYSNYNTYSEGYPASIGFPQSKVGDFEPPLPEWTMSPSGNVNVEQVNYVTDYPLDSLFRSNLNSIDIDENNSFNYRLMYDNFLPCDDFKTAWSLIVLDQSKDATAILTFSDCEGNDTTLFIFHDVPEDTTNKDFLKPLPVWSMDPWGHVNRDQVHYVTDKPENPAIRSNLKYINLASNSYNYKLEFTPFTECQEEMTDWKLIRIDTTKDAFAEVHFGDCAFNDTVLTFNYIVKYDTEPPVPEWTMDSLGNVNKVKQTFVYDMPNDIAVRSNLDKIEMQNSYNYIFTLDIFTRCIDFKTTWGLERVDKLNDAYAEMTFTDCAGNDTTIIIDFKAKVDRIPPQPKWVMESSGNVNVQNQNYVTDQPDETYRSNLDTIYLDVTKSSNYKLFFTPFDKCNDKSTDWGLIILDSKKEANAEVVFKDCAGNDTTLSISFNPLSVNDHEDDNFHIYPNPAQDKLIITGLKNISKISVIDMLGNNLYMKNFDNDNFIDVSGLNNGIYILKIISGRDVFVEKFVIQK